MKTLKQFYKEEEIREDSNLRTFTQDHIEATKKWLTQKQQNVQNTPYANVKYAISAYIRDELIEELNQ